MKIQQLKEDYDMDWWKAKEADDFNLKNKLMRVGCRPLKRKYLACVKSDSYDIDSYAECKVQYSSLHYDLEAEDAA